MTTMTEATGIANNCERNLPSARQILTVILLGIGAMLLSFKYLVSTINFKGYEKHFLLVKDPKTNANLDTLTLIYRPAIAAHLDDLRVDRTRQLKSNTVQLNSKPKIVPDTGIKSISYKKLYFSYNPALLLWIALAAIMCGSAVAVAPLLWNSINHMQKLLDISLAVKLRVAVMTVVIGLLIYVTDKNDCLSGTIDIACRLSIITTNPNGLQALILIPLSVGLLGIAGQLLVNSAISVIPSLLGQDRQGQFRLAGHFRMLCDRLKFFLLIDSVLIVFSVLITDAFRRAIMTEVKVNMDLIPQYYVYLYGVMFTFYLAVIYLPVYYRLQGKSGQMLSELHDIPEGNDQATIRELLSLQQTGIESLKVTLSILAPVITSLVPGLLKL